MKKSVSIDLEVKMRKVNVLLSTYNGERYIKHLIESVLAQKDVEVTLSVRDDSSSDRTIDIIKGFHDPRIKLYIGRRNLGPAKSFLSLLRHCESADYYAYCDQDDIWYPHKIITAIGELEKSSIKPALFMSTYDVVDKDLNIIEKRNMDFGNPFRIETTLMYRCPSGCVMVFNDNLRKVLVKTRPKNLRMHDFWTLLVALGIHADVYTKDIPLLKYRIHGDNTVGLSQGLIDRIRRFYKSITQKSHERYLQAKSMYECCYDLFDDETNDLLMKIVNYRKGIANRFKLAFDNRFREIGTNRYVNTLFIVSVLLGLF